MARESGALPGVRPCVARGAPAGLQVSDEDNSVRAVERERGDERVQKRVEARVLEVVARHEDEQPSKREHRQLAAVRVGVCGGARRGGPGVCRRAVMETLRLRNRSYR